MNRCGFTLIELLVSVFITSIVVLAAFAMLSGSTETFSDEDDRQVLESNMRNAELLIQRDLSRVAYHASFDSSVDKDNFARVPEFQGFFGYNALKTSKGHYISQFAFAADLTDFEGFKVSSQSGDSLTLELALMLPVTASELGKIGPGYTPKPEVASEQAIRDALQKSFDHALAVYGLSGKGNYGIMGLSLGSLYGNQITLAPAAGVGAGINREFVANLGFDSQRPFQDVMISPVVSVVYKAVPSGDGHDLVRCYKTGFPGVAGDGVDANVDNESCQVLVRNVLYFELYPVTLSSTGQTNLSQILSYCNARNAGSFDISGSPYGMSKIKVGDLVGFYFRIAAIGEKVIQGRAAVVPMVNGMASYTEDGKPIVHIQGTVVNKTANTSHSTKYLAR